MTELSTLTVTYTLLLLLLKDIKEGPSGPLPVWENLKKRDMGSCSRQSPQRSKNPLFPYPTNVVEKNEQDQLPLHSEEIIHRTTKMSVEGIRGPV